MLISNLTNKKIFFFLFFLTFIKAYLIFPIEYLPEDHYTFLVDKNNKNETKEDMIKRIYYRNLMTRIELGTPKKNFTIVLDSDDDRYYIASSQRPKISNEPEKPVKYFLFDKNELLNESYSSTYNKGPCEAVDYKTFSYAELCTAKDLVVFNQNHKNIEKKFEFRMVRNNEDNIPGFIGLLYNYKNSKTKHPNFINELRGQDLIDNNYWFFHFDKASPFDRIIQGQLIIGALPHDLFPEQFKKEDYIDFKRRRKAYFHGSWRVQFDKIYVDDKDYAYLISNTLCALNYEMYPIIGSLEFHFRLKENFLEDLLEEGKCFAGKFHQNIHYKKDLTFYYCNNTMKDFLYKKLPNIKFYLEDAGQEFELTKEEIFYEKGDYIYLMILFGGIEFNYYYLGQMFTTKYNFVFNTFYKEIGFYKNNKNNINFKNKSSMNHNYFYGIYAIVIILLPLISLFIGIKTGKKMFGKNEKKQNSIELIDKSEMDSNKV